MTTSLKNGTKLLIVVDMQNDFVSGVLGTPQAKAIVPNVVARVNKASNENEEVLFTRDTHYENYLTTKEGQWLKVPHCIKGTQGWEIIDELNPQYIMAHNKHTFASISMITSLTARQLDSIEIIGLCTDICVISTAITLRSYFPETDIYVNESCCAGTTDIAHKRALETMQGLNINII